MTYAFDKAVNTKNDYGSIWSQCKKPRMNVYFTTVKRLIIYAYPTIISLFENNQDSEIYLYSVSENLEETDIQAELKLAEEYRNHIIILHFDESMEKGKVQSVKGGAARNIGMLLDVL